MHGDRWIADIDLALAIRHEHDLLDKELDKVITCANVNKAVDADLGLSTLTSASDRDNDGHIFRKQCKPNEVVACAFRLFLLVRPVFILWLFQKSMARRGSFEYISGF